MKYFVNIKTAADLKKAYLELAKKYHPDKGGDPEVMKAINAEFDEMRTYFNKFGDKPYAPNAASQEEQESGWNDIPEKLRDAIWNIAHLDGLDIQICGRWIWVGGNTREHSGALKSAGYRWASKKRMWYWRDDENERRNSRGRYSMNMIYDKFGVQTVNRPTSLALN